jgi:hypothetical protein
LAVREVHVVTNQNERFELLVRILEPADYRFIQMRNPAISRRFRRDRLRIFRKELRRIAAESGRAYQRRASRISSAGKWDAYAPLLMETASSFCAIGKLAFAGTMFSWHLPVVIDVGRNARRLLGYLTAPAASVEPRNSPV